MILQDSTAEDHKLVCTRKHLFELGEELGRRLWRKRESQHCSPECSRPQSFAEREKDSTHAVVNAMHQVD